MRLLNTVIVSAFLFAVLSAAGGYIVPMHSFKPPFSTGKNGIRWWEVGGDVIVYQESIHLTEDIKSKKGFIWNRSPVTMKDWEVDIEFKISGEGRAGADGMAFWYTRDRMREGDAFGNTNTWVGLGVIVDTFDNDRKRDNPYISLILNDGTKTYSADKDGKDIESGGCVVQLRKLKDPVWLRVAHNSQNGEVTVSYSMAQSAPEHVDSWKKCVSAKASLPTGYYFGVSAATGGLSDTHEVLSLSAKRIGGDDDVSQKQDEKIRELRGESKKPEEFMGVKKEDIAAAEAEKKIEDISKEIEELKNKPATPQADVSRLTVEQRMERLELMLKKMESQVQTMTSGIDAVIKGAESLDTIKTRLESAAEGQAHQQALKSEISKQATEIERVTKQAQEKISNDMSERIKGLEKQVLLLKDAVDQKETDDRNVRNGKTAGSVLYYVLVVIMALQTIGALVYFSSQRKKPEDKFW